jgi:hypothetical protein
VADGSGNSAVDVVFCVPSLSRDLCGRDPARRRLDFVSCGTVAWCRDLESGFFVSFRWWNLDLLAHN